ncbi:MAG TPA: AMP-binding protein [Ramlibacter sp.]|nr:AMP-binding protein [Ramlibacter sp.]
MTSFTDWVLQRLQEAPDRIALVDGDQRLSRAALFEQARRLGSSLLACGLRAGDAVAFQLPNWHEACVLNLAAALHGFRLVPLLPMYREAEIGFILRECAAQALFLPASFRGLSYPDLLARVQPAPLPAERVYIVRGEDSRHGSYARLLAAHGELAPLQPADRDATKVILYTSGSTGAPKGVIHTDRSIVALITFAREFWQLGEGDVTLVPSPVAHIGGSMYAFELPWIAGLTSVLMDVWNPQEALRLIEAERVSFLAGATPFLEGLLQAAEGAGTRLPSLRRFICGGASVPPALVQRAAAWFDQCTVSRAYGSTEVPIICPGIRSRADAEFGASTDGECAADVQLLDDEGRPVPEGEPGEIVARAPRMFTGYLNPRDNEGAFTADGYFRMGDIGRRVAGRFLEITGRKKDIIIRLGENISPLEIENVLMQHPAIRQVAVVGVPHPRTGEAALAFVVLEQGARFDLADMRAFLQQRGLARQKWPEQLRTVDSLPTNSIGKVLKRELRRLAAES